MPEKKYAHIAQDACGLLKIVESNQWVGLFTDNVESCSIYVFECENAVVMCHDSGQMSIEGIAEVVSQAGNVERVQILKHARNHSHNDIRHRELLSEKLEFSALNVDEISCPWMPFTAIYDSEQRLRAVENGLPIGAESPSDIAYRWAVAKLNNAFIPTNSQSLPGNLQFDGYCYLPALKPVIALQDILKMVEAQPQFLFMNLSVLLLADRDDAVKLPEPVRAFAHAYRITPSGWSILSDQKVAFESFRRQKFSDMV